MLDKIKKRLGIAGACEDSESERFRREIIGDISRTARELKKIQRTYDLVCESELVDSLIYEELALKARYAYLLRTAKENGIRM